MKILHLISQHPESTGSGFYLQNIIKQAEKAGHSNFLIAGISGNDLPTLDCISADFCHFIQFEQAPLDFSIPGMSDVMPYTSSRFSELDQGQLTTYSKAFRNSVQQVVNSFKPDIIHSHHLWLATSAARQAAPSIPLITSCHSTDIRQFHQCPHLRNQVQPHCRNLDRVLALSGSQAERIVTTYDIDPSLIDIVGAGYDSNLFRPYPETMNRQSGKIQLLYAGKLSFAKGVDWLLETVNTLNQKAIHLHIAGSGTGSEGRRCLELARLYPETVSIHGNLTQQELAQLMQESDIFILPSFYEGIPLVLLEALACGCRIITTDLDGCKELLGDASAELVTLIKLPPLPSLDQPAPKDRDGLRHHLRKTIFEMASRVKQGPPPSGKEIDRLTKNFRWSAIFKKISASYHKIH